MNCAWTTTTLAVLLPILLSTGLRAAELPANVTEPYLRVQSSLANDSLEGVGTQAESLATSAATLGPAAKPVADAAHQLARAKTIGDARARFGAVSDALMAYLTASGATPGDGVRTAYCPMQKRYWLQKGASIRNPYYGSGMLTCGEFRK